MDSLIADAVDKYIQSTDEDRRMDGMWHPSSLSSPCVRRAVMEKQMIPFSNPPGDETKRIFLLGKIIHKMVQDAVSLDPNIVMSVPEVEVLDPDAEVTGKADILIYRADTQSYELIEIKSIKAAGVRYGIPKKEHKIQAGTYAYILRQFGGKAEDGTVIPPLGDSLKVVRFVYVEKETMNFHERVQDAAALAAVALIRIGKMKRLEFLEYDELPMIGNDGYWFRNYCPYKGSGFCCVD